VKRTSGATVKGVRVVLDEARVVASATRFLEQSGVYAGPQGKASRAQVSLELDVLGAGSADNPEIGVKVRLKIEIRPASADTARFAEDTAALGQVRIDDSTSGDLVGAFQRLAERTCNDLLLAYAARQRLWVAGESEVAKALTADDDELRIEAIQICGARKLRRELPTILRFLTDDDEATRDAALGAVVAMGERSAIKALAESRQMRDSYEMRKVLDAVATLGGQEAKEYLSFVAETHDDADIRSMAHAALKRLRRREDHAAPTR
jgi:hypothetical protein